MYQFISIVFATFGIVSLVLYGFNVGNLVAPLAALVEAYAFGLDMLLGWTEPVTEHLLHRMGWDIELRPHWQHFFLITFLWWGAVARVQWLEDNTRDALITLVIGLCVTFPAAVMTGMIDETLSACGFTALPALSFFIGYLLLEIVYRFRSGSRWSLLIFVLAPVPCLMVYASSCYFTNWVSSWDSILKYGNPSFIASGLLVLLLAEGWRVSSDKGFWLKRNDDSEFAFVNSLPVRCRAEVGKMMWGSFLGTAAFFAIDAGLKLVKG